MRDLIIGLAIGYNWEKLEPFAVSIASSGFTGDVVLFTGDMDDISVAKLTSLGIKLMPIPVIDFSNAEIQNYAHFHFVGRFLLIQRYLQENPEYRFVICTDTRDVVFQKNPSKWLEENIKDNHLVAASEFVEHRNQPHNKKWINQGFQELSEWMLDKPVYCAGVIAGKANYVRDLAGSIYLVGRNLSDKIWGACQPSYNSIIHQEAYRDITYVPSLSDKWTFNVSSFSGVVDIRDIADFTILHQYDRSAELNELILKRYNLNQLLFHC